MFLTDIDLIRIQFINKVYRLIDQHLGRLIYNRDDKISTSLFYISDFIFKFHSRAFHRTSLERLDEIIDVHQSSDLRSMLDQLVAAFNGEILRPILNGMFEYRFTSTIASEIKYLSRFSPSEAAAFNFALDESHSLKEMHLRKIKGERGSLDDLIALGELYEYDREYDNAVNQYQCAIELLDKKLKVAGINENGYVENAYLQVLSIIESEPEFFDITISFIIDWAVSRLRLMLRIGLVFEQRKDFERAGTNYHEAHIFSRRLLKVCLNEKVALKIPDVENADKNLNDTMCPSTYYLAKHLTILYQAVFAKAWVAEKELTGIDASVLIVNTELFYVEKLLPFKLSFPVESYKKEVAKGKILHPTFALLKSEMYKKSGDLCFYKGATLPDLEINNTQNQVPRKHPKNPLIKQGYLYRASYFYSASLHYLRHFNIFMIQSSKKKYGLNHPAKDWENGVFSTDQLSEYPLTESASSILEYAETLIARVDLEELSAALTKPDHNLYKRYTYDLSLKRLFAYTIQAHTAMDTWLKGKLDIEGEVKDSSVQFFSKLGYAVNANLKYIEENQDSYSSQAERSYLIKLKDISYHEDQFSLLNEFSDSKQDDSATDLKAKQSNGNIGKGKVNNVKDFISMWLGNAETVEPKSPHDTVMYSDTFSPSAIEKLVLYTVLVNQAARWQLRSGQKHDASHEYRRGMTTIVTALENILLLIIQSKKGGEYNPEEKIPLIPGAESLFSLLVTRAVYFYERSLRFSSSGISKSEHTETDLNADNIHGKLVVQILRLNAIVHNIEKYFCKGFDKTNDPAAQDQTSQKQSRDFNLAPRLFCYFGDNVLAGNPARSAADIKVHSYANALQLLVKSYTSRDLKNCFGKPLNHKFICSQVAAATPDILFRYSLVHRSTVQGRIIALQHMLFCLTTEPYKAGNDKTSLIFNRAEELLELMEQFDVNSDFLFAKTAIGCFLGAKYIANCPDDEGKQKQRYLLQRARELLNKNHELYTMRAAYYQRVSNMYYLFDDFNDRTTHHGKALQIMSSVLTWKFEEECRKELSKSVPIKPD